MRVQYLPDPVLPLRFIPSFLHSVSDTFPPDQQLMSIKGAKPPAIWLSWEIVMYSQAVHWSRLNDF